MKKLITAIVLLSALFCLTACNTMEGIGKDFQEAGQSMQEAAD